MALYRRKDRETQAATDSSQDANAIIKTQTKYLTTNITGTGIVNELSFNNLVLGKRYRVEYDVRWQNNSNLQNGILYGAIRHNGTVIRLWEDTAYSTNQGVNNMETVKVEFVAIASNVQFEVLSSRLDAVQSVNCFLHGNANPEESCKATIYELPNVYQEVTDYT